MLCNKVIKHCCVFIIIVMSCSWVEVWTLWCLSNLLSCCRFCQSTWYWSRRSSCGGLVGQWEWSREKCHSAPDFNQSVSCNFIPQLCRRRWLSVPTGACECVFLGFSCQSLHRSVKRCSWMCVNRMIFYLWLYTLHYSIVQFSWDVMKTCTTADAAI